MRNRPRDDANQFLFAGVSSFVRFSGTSLCKFLLWLFPLALQRHEVHVRLFCMNFVRGYIDWLIRGAQLVIIGC